MEVQTDASNVEMLRWFSKHLNGIMSGSVQSDAVQVAYEQTTDISSAAGASGPASALLTASSLSGSVGAVVGRTTVTVTASGGDTTTMAAVAAAINANSTVNQFAYATSSLMQFTCVSVVAGDVIGINGVTFTAVDSGISFSQLVPGQFPIGASDTATATNLCTAISRHPALSPFVRAVRIAGVVYVGMSTSQALPPSVGITKPTGSATFTIQAGTPTAGAYAMVFTSYPGQIGNEIALTASGTGMTATSMGTSGYLGLGTGGQPVSTTWLVRP